MTENNKEQYVSPECDVLQMTMEGVIASTVPKMPGEDY